MKISQSASMATIKLSRKLFYNTPVQKWGITTKVYQSVFRAGHSTGDLTTNYFGVEIKFPAHDITITPGLAGGFYEKNELGLFRALCEESSRVVDIGGNIGLYSLIAASTGCEVDVFEPVPENLGYLSFNVTQNGLENKVRVINKAVSSEKGTAKIYVARNSIGTHSLSSKAAGSKNSIEVDVTTLDNFLNEFKKIDILKIDVEGYDGFVIEGGAKLLQKTKPTLFIEMAPSNLINAGYEPEKFVELVFSTSQYVYGVDEVKQRIFSVNKNDVLKYARRRASLNLVAVNSEKHKNVIESYKEGK